jgi:hypothetical protein
MDEVTGISSRRLLNRRRMLVSRLQLVCLAIIAMTLESSGQEPTVLLTGSGPASANRSWLFPSSVDTLRLQFDFGFGTDETPQTPGFLDSFTVTLQDNSMQSTAIYLTADPNGVSWAPVTPGTVFMNPNSINRAPISFGGVQPSHSTEFAYRVDAPIPTEFAGKSATLYFDLFDNANGTSSLGWFNNVVVVPEPGTAVLTGLGGTILVFFVRHRR